MLNSDIYQYNHLLNKIWTSDTLRKKILPVKINFCIHKNKKIMSQANECIDDLKYEIISKYGTYDESDDSYNFTKEARKKANEDLDELLKIDQNIDIAKIKLSDLEGLEFTLEQMEALMFMIEED